MSTPDHQQATQTFSKSSNDHLSKINSTLTHCGLKRKVSPTESVYTYPQQRRRVSSGPTDLLNTFSYSVRAKSEPIFTVTSFVNSIPKRKAGDLNLSIPDNNKKIKSSGDHYSPMYPFISRADAPPSKKVVGNLLPYTTLENKKDIKSMSCDANHLRYLLHEKKRAVSPLMRKAYSHLGGCVAEVREVEERSADMVAVDKGKDKVRNEDERVVMSPVKDSKDDSEEGVLTEEELEAAELMRAVKGLPEYYKLVSKIGEGSFGAVYKAKDVRQDLYNNESWQSLLPQQEGEQFVALKRVFNTCNPDKVAREIDFLYTLKGSACIAPIITAFRKEDEVFIVMPCLESDDFASSYNQMTMIEIKGYFKSLFTALDAVHKHGIIHRDVKPGNFLYNREANTGFLIDFGLAEDTGRGRRIEEHYSRKRQSNAAKQSQAAAIDRTPYKFVGSEPSSSRQRNPLGGLVMNDARDDVAANCAGTRGYQAPETLMKVTRQTTAIDIWSVGIIMADIVTGRYPFFLSTRPEDTLVELMQVFGKRAVTQCARVNGRTLSTNIDISDVQLQWSDIAEVFNKDTVSQWDPRDFHNLTDLLEKCLRLNPYTRITAEAALKHPFFA